MRIFFIWNTLVIIVFSLNSPVLAENKIKDLTNRVEKIEDRLKKIEDRLKDIKHQLSQDVDIESFREYLHNDVKKIINKQKCDGARLDKKYFIICYHKKWRTARWVGYHLDKGIISGTAIVPNDFREDTDLPPENRSTITDYKNANYDKGHMAPTAAFRSNPEAMSLTFLLSNITPRSPHLNRKTWPLLERFIINLTSKGKNTWVFTGNIVNKENNNKLHDRVTIPDSCFKAILHEDKEGNLSAYAFIMPNTALNLNSLEDYMHTMSELKDKTGIDFFADLPDKIKAKLENKIHELPI